MSEIIPNKYVQRIKPYKVSERFTHDFKGASNINLDWNEATRTPSALIKDAIINFLSVNDLSSYPNPCNEHLSEVIAQYAGVNRDQLQYFCGSDEGLNYVARTFLAPDDVVVSLSPNYDNFRVYVEACGASYVEIFYDAPFSPSINNFLKLEVSPKLVYISNPNNPTGVLLTDDAINAIAAKYSDALVVIDEAYYEFAGYTAARLLAKYRNIIISRTFSKAFGLAGVRLGYLLADGNVISNINRLRNPKNINVIAQLSVEVAIKDAASMLGYVSEVVSNRDQIVQWLLSKNKIVRNGKANFIMVQCDSPHDFVYSMRQSGVTVRDRSSMALLDGYVRITIGGNDSADKLRLALSENLDLLRASV